MAIIENNTVSLQKPLRTLDLATPHSRETTAKFLTLVTSTVIITALDYQREGRTRVLGVSWVHLGTCLR